MLLAAWLGAAALFTLVVAPAAFAILPSRTLAGALVGRVLPVLFIWGLIVGMLLLVLLLGGQSARFAVARSTLGGLIAAACAWGQLIVAPRIAHLRESVGISLDALAPDDPRRAAFGRLHALSVAGLGVSMMAAAVALVLLALALRGRSGA